MPIRQSLEKLGLTQNEIDIYIYLLKSGQRTGPQIHTELSLDKSSAYRALSALEEKNLIDSEGETRNQSFIAMPIEKLMELQKMKEAELQIVRTDLKSFVQDLEEFTKTNYKSRNIEVFEGENSYYAIMEEVLKTKADILRTINTTTRVYTIAGSDKRYFEYQKTYIPRRVNQNMHIRILYDRDSKNDELDISNPKTLKEARRYPGKLELDCLMDTFGTKSSFKSEKAGHFWGIIIDDRLITNLLNSMFDAIWDISTEVTTIDNPTDNPIKLSASGRKLP